MQNKFLVAVSAASLAVAVASTSALTWTYCKVREFEKEHEVSIFNRCGGECDQAAADGEREDAAKDSTSSGQGAKCGTPQMNVVGVEYDGDTELAVELSERPDMDVVRHYVSVSPMKEGSVGFTYRARLRERDGAYDFRPFLLVRGEFAHRTNVTLRIRKGLPRYGKGANPKAEGSLAEDFIYTFTRKDVDPYVKFAANGRYLPPAGRRAIGVESVNVTNVHAELRRVEPRNVVQMLAREENVYSKYSNYDWRSGTSGADKEDTTELSGEAEVMDLPCMAAPNEKNVVPFRLALKDGGPKNGIYLATIRSGDHPRRDSVSWWDDDAKTAKANPNRYRVVCVSDLGLSVRASGEDDAGVWVASLTTGRPVAGARIEVYSSANVKVKEGVAPRRVASLAP